MDESRTNQANNRAEIAPSTASGRVFLVGSGPGDVGLLTQRAVECLAHADVVLYDGLANPQILELAQSAEHRCVGKHGRSEIWTQARINATMVELALQGKRVVRLKGGDPALFARTGEELNALVDHGIRFEVVPGVTAALAAASYVGMTLTNREHSSAVAFVTGHQRQVGEKAAIDWDALARFPGTLVIYMGVTTVREWSRQLLQAGMPGETPVAAIRRCSWNDQRVVRSRLDRVGDELTPPSKLRPPVVFVIGEAAHSHPELDWFTSRPLHGCGILLTHTQGAFGTLAKQLRELGASVYHQPMLRILPPNDWAQVDREIRRMADMEMVSPKDWQGVLFASGHSVSQIMGRIQALGRDSRVFANHRIAAVGPSTADRLASFGLKADVVPDRNWNADGLFAALRSLQWLKGRRWLVFQTNRSGGQLEQNMRKAEAVVECVQAYRTEAVAELKATVRDAMDSGNIHFCTITSAAVAEAALHFLEEHVPNMPTIALGARVADHLRTLGCQVASHSKTNGTEGLLDAVVEAWQQIRE